MVGQNGNKYLVNWSGFFSDLVLGLVNPDLGQDLQPRPWAGLTTTQTLVWDNPDRLFGVFFPKPTDEQINDDNCNTSKERLSWAKT